MKSDSVCPDCGAQRESSPDGDYCPACYLLVGLEGIDAPIDESLNEVVEKAGDHIDRFELLEEIGEGGFGVVFRALQTAPVRRTLALKVIKPGMDSREVVARFEAERQALALMDHPHIAKVYDAGTTALGRPFFVMELVEGLPLTTFCDKNKLCIRQRLELFTKICNGVQHAHQKGIIHRDLKPSNILVHFDDSGVPGPKIIDFGVAKAIGIELTEQTFFTLFGRLVGTPEYMSPEQAQLNALDVDTRSDIYALGVVLHELLAGCVPLNRDQLTKNGYDEMRRMIRELEPLKSSSCFAALSEKKRESISKSRQTDSLHLERSLRNDLDWIVMKSIDKDRNRRYETAQGFGNDIKNFLSGLPVSAGPPSSAYRVGKFISRHRTGAIISSLTVLALIVGTVASFSAYQTLSRAAIDKEKHIETAKQDFAKTQRALRKTLILSAKNHRVAKGEGWLSAALNDIREASQISIDDDLIIDGDRLVAGELRNETLAILAGSDMEKVDLELLLGDSNIPVAFSKDHSLVAIARKQEEMEIHNLSDGTTKRHTVSISIPLDNCQLAFGGNNNRYLVISSNPPNKSQLEVIDLESAETCIPLIDISNHAYDFLPDHQGLAIAQSDSIRFLGWNKEPLHKPLDLPGTPISLALCEASSRLAVGFQSPSGNVRDGHLSIFDYPSGKKLPLGHSSFEPWELSWSSSGKYLAMANADKGLTVFEPGVINTDQPLSGHSTKIRQITWSSDDRLLATASPSDRDIHLWDTSHWQQLSTHGALAANFSFSPDNTQLGPVISDEKLFSLKIQNSKVCHHAIGHRGPGGIVATAWDSRVSEESQDPQKDRYSLAFATAGNDSVIIWNRKGRELGNFSDVTKPAGLAFSASWFYMAGKNGIFRSKTTITDKTAFGPYLAKGITPCEMHFKIPGKFSKLEHCGQIAITPDEKNLIAVSDSGVWLIDTKDESTQLIQEGESNTQFDIDPEGQWLAVISDESQEVRIYKLPIEGEKLPARNAPFKTLPIKGVTAVAFSEVLSNGTILLATGESTRYRFWNANEHWTEETTLEIPTEESQSSGRIAFSPRGTALAVSYARDKLKVLDPENMQVLTKPGFDSQWPLSISSDGALIGTEGHHGRLFIWDLKTVRDEFEDLGIDWKTLQDFTQPLDMHILTKVTISSGEEGQ